MEEDFKGLYDHHRNTTQVSLVLVITAKVIHVSRLPCQVFYTTNASLFQQPGNLVVGDQLFNLTNDQVTN